MFSVTKFVLILSVFFISSFVAPYQELPAKPGYIPVYIREGNTPLSQINPQLIEAFHEREDGIQKEFTLCLANPTTGTTILLPTCPVPSEQMLKCLGQWACQHAIRLDLRCLLSLNGNPLLGGLLGGTGLLGGGAPGAGTGIVGGLLGR